MRSKSRGIGIWMASGAMAGALLGAAIGIFSDWTWIAVGVPIGLAVGFGIGVARAARALRSGPSS